MLLAATCWSSTLILLFVCFLTTLINGITLTEHWKRNVEHFAAVTDKTHASKWTVAFIIKKIKKISMAEKYLVNATCLVVSYLCVSSFGVVVRFRVYSTCFNTTADHNG